MYKKNVSENAHLTEKTFTKIIDLRGFTLTQYQFVQSLKPRGKLSNFIYESLRPCWNKEWNDKIMLSQFAIMELRERNSRRHLDKELPKAKLNRMKLIESLELHFRSLGIELSEFNISTPMVKKQTNIFDCGFNVLLYIKGYENDDIHDIDEDMVLNYRMELTKYLLVHRQKRVQKRSRDATDINSANVLPSNKRRAICKKIPFSPAP